jgi:phosphoribulokinase
LRLDDAGFNKCFQMRYISNQDITGEEFERYKRHHAKNMHQEITKGEVQDCLKRLEEAKQ